MTSAIFFVLVCLGAVAMAVDPWPCLNFRQGYSGECTVDPQVSKIEPGYRHANPCTSLKCALPKPGGGHKIARKGRPADGTPCELFKFCKAGKCVDVPAHQIPILSGFDTTFDCRP